jgi:diaminopimelate epimerase
MIRVPGNRRFFKMTGSGNDFVFVDNMRGAGSWLQDGEEIRRVCDRRMGIGADGVVFMESSQSHPFRMIYLNSDGSRASFCGNAALCSTRLAMELGIAVAGDFTFDSDYGPITARIHRDGLPEIDLPTVTGIETDIALPLSEGELRVGFAVVGVPHAVVLCNSADEIELSRRGPVLRHHPATSGGANVDFISASADGGEWRMRTFERGVEAETLACGSGAVASAILASAWTAGSAGAPPGETVIRTSSGLPLFVRTSNAVRAGEVTASLRGEGRVVFEGELRPW